MRQNRRLTPNGTWFVEQLSSIVPRIARLSGETVGDNCFTMPKSKGNSWGQLFYNAQIEGKQLGTTVLQCPNRGETVGDNCFTMPKPKGNSWGQLFHNGQTEGKQLGTTVLQCPNRGETVGDNCFTMPKPSAIGLTPSNADRLMLSEPLWVRNRLRRGKLG